MGQLIYVTQRTNRHVVKTLDTSTSPAHYETSFGLFEVKGSDTTRLAYPSGIASDLTNSIYVCDYQNQRIIKLSSSLIYVAEYSTRLTIGNPCAILFDITTGDLYVAGVYNNAYVRIQRLTTSLVSVRASDNLNVVGDLWFRPTGICRGFDSNSFIVSGARLGLYQTIESSSFSAFTVQSIIGENTTYPKLFMTTVYNSIIKHSNGDVYLNNGKKIIRVNSLFTNIGDSNFISKAITGLKEGVDGSILVYLADSQKLTRRNENMNFVEDIYYTTASTIALDAFDIADFIEIV
jgi:hypothetical protein